jgi:hypothetical protein
MKTLILITGFGLLVTLCGCRVNHKMSGDVGTTSTVRVEVDCPICNDPAVSFEQRVECLKICLNPTVGASVDDEITELLSIQAEDQAVDPVNTLGGI